MIDFSCPRCNRDMALNDAERGQYAFCKHCAGRVWIPADAALAHKDQEATATASVRQPNPQVPPATPQATSRPNNNLTPPAIAKRSNIPEPPRPPAATTDMPSHPPTPVTRDRSEPHDTTPLQQPVPPPQPSEVDAPQHSSRHHATLITAEPAQSGLAAASDGQLPELALRTDDREESRNPSSAESNRWLTIGVVCLSLLFSAVLLLIETGSSVNSQAKTKNQYRMRIQEKYFGPENGPWPRYQRYLRDAALARSQGNYQDEERYYRKVLHLLNAQHLDKTDQGVTGLRKKTSDGSLKSDEELMVFLSALLNNNMN